MSFKTPDFWHQDHSWQRLALLPLSGLYWLGLKADKWCKQQRLYTPGVPVISIGNITAGGSGKTPVTGFLAYHLAQKGEKVAIVSRGFGAKITKPRKVTPADVAEDVGDEPLMLATDLFDHKVEVWVGASRWRTAKAAEEAGASVLILDDGMQTWRLHRDMDIAVVDSRYNFGNKAVLPAGPLREPIENLARCDFIVGLNGPLPKPAADLNKPYCLGSLHASKPDLLTISQRIVIAFCGIAYPKKFFDMLEKHGVEMIDQRAFGDHHPFTENELERLRTDAFNAKALLVTTPKDYHRLPPHFRKKCLAIRPRFNTEDMMPLVKATIKTILKTRVERTDRRKKPRSKSAPHLEGSTPNAE